jgi:uncharacterized protein
VGHTSSIELTNHSGDHFCANLHLPEGTGPFGVVVVCHGFKGFKDWGFIPHLCDSLAEAGIAALRFNFSHNGVVGHSQEFEALDKFAVNLIGKELEDLSSVLDYICTGRVETFEQLDASRIGLLGHSRGGGIAILTARDRPEVKCLAGWASISHFDRFTPEAIAKWREAGVMYVENTLTGQKMPMDIAVMDDFEANRERYDVRNAVAELDIPLLLVNGDKDESVSLDEMRELMEASKGEADTLIIERANHTFQIGHPRFGSNRYYGQALEETVSFFKKPLGA